MGFSRTPPSPLFPTRLRHPGSGMQNVVLWHVVLRACLFHTSLPLRPTAPPKRSSPRGREASASARHAVTHHAAGRQTQGFLLQTSITPLPCHARASRVCHAKCSAMACRFACLLVKLVTASKTHCSTQALLTQGSNGFCISASCGHPSCSRSSDTRLPHAYLHHPSSPPGSSIQSLACKQYCYGMTFCVLAGFHHHHRKDPLLHPSAPRPGVERLLRQRVMLRPIMQQDVRLKASARTPPSPLFPTSLDHLSSGMQKVVPWHVKLRACLFHTRHRLSDPLLHPTAPRPGVERLLRPHVMRPCIMQQAVRHIKGFLAQTSITPLPYHARASRVWHAKCFAMACPFACLLFKLVTASHTHCSTQALLTQGSNGFCISASCGHPSCSRSSDTRLPHAHLHHPSSPPGSSIQSLACKI